jgi:hypothetical protein
MIPPVIIRTYPDSAATRVQDNRIELAFSEYVDRRSVEEAIFLSPPAGDMEFEWSGKEVTILLAETLRHDRTYVLSVGTDVIDQRAKNRMASGFSLAFSTGDSLDQGAISGRVYDPKPEGLLVFAYLLNQIDRDTLNPARIRPDYLMQTGTDGRFILSNLAWGSYRIFVFRDEYRNLLYDPQLDQYGVYTADLTLSSETPRGEGVGLRVAKEDTTAPFLSNVHVAADRLIRFRFSERVDSASFAAATFILTDTLSGRAVTPLQAYQGFPDQSGGAIILAEPLASPAAYALTVDGIRDSMGWHIDSLNASLVFESTVPPDTVPPAFSILSFADTLLGYPLTRPFQVVFGEPVDRDVADGAFVLADTAGQQTALAAHWLSPIRLILEPSEELRSATHYLITVKLDSLRDLQGNRYQDSTRTIRFVSYNPERAGEMEGVVRGVGSDGSIVVTAVRLSDLWRRESVLDGDGSFAFSDLPEGRFFVEAYLDEDRSGSYSYGLPFPFRQSERFVVGSDTVKVRPRWSASGLTLIIP